MNVLFITSNIPTPSQRNNNIILTIAEEISKHANVEILYPKPFVPFFLNFIEKYKKMYKGNAWVNNGKEIRTYTYFRLPVKGWAFRLFNGLLSPKIKFHNDVVPDLVHAHYVFADGSLALLIHKKYNVPYVVTVRGDDARKIENLEKNSFDYNHAREVLENASDVLCLNHYQKNVIESCFDVSVSVLPHGIEESEIIEPVTAVDSSVINVTVVGELIEQKKIHWVINAVKNYQGNQELKLSVFGDGPLRSLYESDCAESDNIFILGKVPRDVVMDALVESEVFCLPSERETFGLVYVEAAAKGNAIVARYNDGIWENFIEGEEALYAKDEFTFNQLFNNVVENASLRNSLILKANTRVRDFSWINITEKYFDVYTAALKK